MCDTLPANKPRSAKQRSSAPQGMEQVRRALALLIHEFNAVDHDSHRSLLSEIPAHDIYQAAVTILLRVLFIRYAEAQGLLPIANEYYRDHLSLSQLHAQLQAAATRRDSALALQFDAWPKLLRTFRSLFSGVQCKQLSLPAYGGMLFAPARFPWLEEGSPSSLQPLQIPNATVLSILSAFPEDHIRPLEVEYLGQVYEALLDHTAQRATEIMVGLLSSRSAETVIALSELEKYAQEEKSTLSIYLHQVTQRSTAAILNTWQTEISPAQQQRLQEVCSTELYARLTRFAAFIRCDAAGIPAIYRPGDLFLVRSSERRTSGTHYTPQSITEPVVRHTLEPLVYEGPDEGWPKKDWRLRSAEEILSLRVCDIACGSGAFLLQACRYLAERLIESEGNLASHPTPARLRIAQHCLCGVDQNAGAVEVAKLSLWLLTAARDEPFTFLNQALHSGDSLVGAVDGSLVNQPTPPAHWNALNWWQAFPAVMQQQGFDAIIGNPPFVGGRKIRRALGGDYLRYLTAVAEPGGSGNSDLCAYFFRRAFRLCNARGKIGFVATNSIAEGDTRATGLEQILHWGGVIYRADDDYPWPGVAAVTVAIVHLSKSPTRLPRWLDGAGVAEITASLQAFSVTEHKRSLPQNERLCYQGSVLAAKGFILTADEAALMLASDPANAAVIVPYYTGDEVFNSATLVPQRYVIDFRDWSLEQASRYLEPFRRVQETVFPVRQRVNRKSHRERWWQYGDKRPALYAALSGLQETLVQLRHAKYLCPQFAPTNGVFSESTVVFPTDQIEMFALLNSIIHAAWARETSGSLGTEMRYTPRDCLFTFPLPPVRKSLAVTTVGQQLRSAIDEIKQSRNCGITGIYNLFHSDHVRGDDIESLRELHQKLDHAIATLYGWDDLIFAREFVRTKLGMRWTIPDHLRKIVLTRLLELNHSLSKSLPQ